MASSCPRCERGVKNDWDYCAWCYGPGFVEESTRTYPDKRYTAQMRARALSRSADAVHALLSVVSQESPQGVEIER